MTLQADPRRVRRLNLANAFTFLRVGLVPVFAWLLLVREPPLPVLAAVVFAVAAATDGLDGYVARRLDLVTGLGQFLDPLADKLLVGTALGALAVAGRIPWGAALVILFREVAVSVLRVVLARRGRSLPASSMGKAKTVLQIIAVVALTALPRQHRLSVGLLALAVGVTVISGCQYFADARGGRAGVPWS
ncbi:MAG TPA: CDP-diacylglycerol--glycerol-3-phosphate 3-phosphatidyltransferase [Actinomycetota bacterium]|nr:CDP-diacylglycerol--glycerol-3-phosphate 3-phosphatidyltransferase [Actinomycetota bacterium]